MRIGISTFVALALLFLLNFLPSEAAVQAQVGYPQERDRYINDFADIITTADETRIRMLLEDLEERSDVEGTVVTVGSIEDYGVSHPDIETFARELFDGWGIGSASTNDGVLFLVALEDRALRIELGEQYRGEYDVALSRIIDEVIIPEFQADQYSLGIVRGVEATIERIIGPRERAKQSGESAFPTPVFRPQSDTESVAVESSNIADSGGVSWIWILLGIGVIAGGGVLAYNYYRIRERTRPRPCPNCEELMVMLDETEDDMYLDTGQKAEEYLKSVDYDVWLCPNCDLHNVYPHPARFTRYRQCPTCGYITVDTYDQVLETPTVYSAGRKQIVSDCQHCSYHREETVIIPRVQKQVSPARRAPVVIGGGSSGSAGRRTVSRPSRTFGGGRSGGGGATGRW